MIDTLLQFGSNSLLSSLALACLAIVAQRYVKSPRVMHLLWLLVLAKLLMPTWIGIPVLSFESAEVTTIEASLIADEQFGAFEATYASALALSQPALEETAPAASAWNMQQALLVIWISGICLLAAVSAARVFRFHRHLRRISSPVGAEVERLARQLGRSLQLARQPRIVQVRAKLSPMLWWMGGRPTVVIPARLLEAGYEAELRWALAHELGHFKRRDHWVRWLEWAAIVLFWWNPIAWWARRNLRVHEELCCDTLVLQSLQPNPKTYANSLLNVIEFLAQPTLRPPAMASAMNSGGAFEQRLQMILNHKPSRASRSLRALSLLAAAMILPVGFAAAQHEDPRSRPEAQAQDPVPTLTVEQFQRYAQHIKIAVDAGELSIQEADRKLAALRELVVAPELDPIRAVDVRLQYEADMLAGNPILNEALKRKQLAAEHAKREQQYNAFAAQLKSAVGSGLMTKEEADIALQKARARMAGPVMDGTVSSFEGEAENRYSIGESVLRGVEYQSMAQRIAEALDAGIITSVEAEKKMGEVRDRYFAESLAKSQDDYLLAPGEYAVNRGVLGQLVQAQEEAYLGAHEREEAQRQEEQSKRGFELHLALNEDGKTYFRDRALSLEQVQRLVDRASVRGRVHVIISSTDDASYKVVTSLIDAAIEGGAREVSISRPQKRE